MQDLTKCRSSKNFREGSAVSAPPTSLDSNSPRQINSVTHGNANKSWDDFAAIIAPRWDNIGYYYVEHP